MIPMVAGCCPNQCRRDAPIADSDNLQAVTFNRSRNHESSHAASGASAISRSSADTSLGSTVSANAWHASEARPTYVQIMAATVQSSNEATDSSAQMAKQSEQAARLAEAQQAALQAEAEKRRTYIPTDLMMPSDVEDLIVGDGVTQYNRIREVESKLDSLILRKKLDLQNPLQNRIDKCSTLKIWISNTVENQPWQGRDLEENAFDFDMGVEATYKVKIMGRVLDDEVADPDTNMAETSESTPPKKRVKFSHLFKAITVDFDRNKNLQPESMSQIEWKKPKPPPQMSGPASNAPLPAEADFDQLEFERKSDENVNCTISLYRDEFPERYQLSKELSEVLDMEELDRAGVVGGIWEYAKAMGLQHEEEKRYIRCDARLGAVSKRSTSLQPFK